MLFGIGQIINGFKRINKEYIFLFLIILLVGFLLYSTTSMSQAPEEITLTSFYPSPFGEYNEILTKRVLDYDNPLTYVLDPSGESTMCNIRLLAASAATTDLGGLTLDGKIHGTSAENYYIDLNDTTVPPVHMIPATVNSMYSSIYINSIRTESYIFMGSNTPDICPNPAYPDGAAHAVDLPGGCDPSKPPHTTPYVGKHVYDVSEGMMAGDCEPGDVMLISPDKDQMLVRSSKRFDPTIAGVISENPKLYLGALPDRKPVALIGIVKCKVTAENGPIERGDLLVSASNAGYAMRADVEDIRPGMLIGKALQVLEKGKAKIYILINKQ